MVFGHRLVAPPATPGFGLFWCSFTPSWRLSLWFYSHLWPLDGPGTCFLGLCLGFFLLASCVGCRVLVGLPSWSCCSSGLRGSVVFLVCMLGHLSLVRSVFFLSPRSWRCFPYFGWVCFWSSCSFTASGWRFGLRLALVRTAVRPSPGLVLLLHPGFFFSGLVVWGSFHPVPSPLSSFGMWSPFRVISVFCHSWSPTKVSFGGVFLLGGSLPFRCGVVVSLRPLSVCHGSLWLVTALFPSLSLSLPVPIFSWLLLLLRQVPWVCCLTFPMVVRTLAVGPGVSYASCLSFALLRALGILVPVASLLH